MRTFHHATAAALLAAWLATATAAGDGFQGKFHGAGKACQGALTITGESMTWLTPSTRCRRAAYEVIDRGSNRITFRLARSGAQCRHSVLSLVHDGSESPDNGWQAVGYSAERSYRDDKAAGFASHPPGMLSCDLIRDPAYPAPVR